MLTPVWYVLAAPVAICLLISVVLFMQVRMLRRAKLERLPPEKVLKDRRREPIEPTHAFTEPNGFEFQGYFALTGVNGLIAAWQRADRPTFFCHYVLTAGNQLRTSFDFVTLFADEIGLTTGSNRDGHLMPRRPTSFLQTFSDRELEGLWAAHLETEEYLMDHGGARLVAMETSFEEAFESSIRRSAEYVGSLPLWPLRGTYWYFVRRYAWHGLTVRQQRERGWVKLPNALAAAAGGQ